MMLHVGGSWEHNKTPCHTLYERPVTTHGEETKLLTDFILKFIQEIQLM